MILEAWRTCLQDEFDLPNLAILLDELASGVIRIGEVSTPAPSPFCSELLWKQTGGLMYADDDALEELLAEWLRYYGPIDPSVIARLFGLCPKSGVTPSWRTLWSRSRSCWIA
jgi:ATP-dependent Lhr-like helicase